MTDTTNNELKAYLRRLRWALAKLPAPERSDIAQETEAHIRDRVAQGQPQAQALEELGTPETYARGFIDELQLSQALVSRSFGTMAAALLRRAPQNIAASIALVIGGLAGIVAVGMGSLSIFKFFAPDNTGLFRSPTGGYHFSFQIPAPLGQELLGDWLYPVSIASLLFGLWLCRLIWLWGVRNLHRSELK